MVSNDVSRARFTIYRKPFWTFEWFVAFCKWTSSAFVSFANVSDRTAITNSALIQQQFFHKISCSVYTASIYRIADPSLDNHQNDESNDELNDELLNKSEQMNRTQWRIVDYSWTYLDPESIQHISLRCVQVK